MLGGIKPRHNLQRVGEELVHLGDLGRHAEVDGAVANLHDEAANNVRVDLERCENLSCQEQSHCPRWAEETMTYLVGDLELLALADVGGLGDGRLEPVKGLVVELLRRGQLHDALKQFYSALNDKSGFLQMLPLFSLLYRRLRTRREKTLPERETRGFGKSYLSGRDDELDLALGGADELAELLADAREEAEAVVLRQGGEEVLYRLAGRAGLLLKLGDDGGLVLGGEGRGGQDAGELGVLGDDALELREGLGGRVEAGGLDGGGVLYEIIVCQLPNSHISHWSEACRGVLEVNPGRHSSCPRGWVVAFFPLRDYSHQDRPIEPREHHVDGLRARTKDRSQCGITVPEQ